MFDPGDAPRVFGLAPGVDFPAALVAGLKERLKGQPPDAMARVDLIVNTRRMARRLREIFDAGPAGFLPRIRLLTDLDGLVPNIQIAPARPPLQSRLELVQLVLNLLDTTEPRLAPRTSLYDLSDSLAALIDEMQGEGVDVSVITGLDVSDQSGHWERAKAFLGIAQDYLAQVDAQPNAEARQRQLVKAITAHWQEDPPQNPVILAGSTGSRGTTSLLMQAVARLPMGAVVLPGFDFDLPTAVWHQLNDALMSEDHPQYRFRSLMRALDLPRGDISAWIDQKAPSPARNKLISLSLRPAPVTHAWLSEGPDLANMAEATKDLTLIEAPSPRVEALTIAMRLRKAVEDGQTAALITPDRMLTRQVTSALDRWNILPDDSAGTPLQLSPPGRLLRHIAALFQRRLDAAALLALLKHPLTHSGVDRNLHQLYTQQLEMRIRQDGLPYPDRTNLRHIGEKAARKMDTSDGFLSWIDWVADTFTEHDMQPQQPLSVWVETHLQLARAIASGSASADESELWNLEAGEKAHGVMSALNAHAAHGGSMLAMDYANLIGTLLSAEEVRDRDAPHPDVMIWGTLEARVQGADLVILGGLNDGVWPEAPPPDPWLNRSMRAKTGLLLPERRIGLSAHDYQQAVAAPEVWLSRAVRSDDAETVPSRWLNRLGNLLGGLTTNRGPECWQAMQDRGSWWLDQATALEAVKRTQPAPRPAPRPPVAARPRKLSVTEIKHLIRDPYAIYAKHTLRLRAMRPLVQSPDAPLRGIVLHEIMERFVEALIGDPSALTKAHLIETAEKVLTEQVPWPAARLMWLARIERVADWFIQREKTRQGFSSPVAFEDAAKGVHVFADLGFTLTGYADRIDMSHDGDALIYDYKTGTPPTKKQQKQFDKQLLLEAAMVEQGGFKEVGVAHVAQAVFIGLGSTPKEEPAPLDDETPAQVLQGLHSLVASYLSPLQGFTARRIVEIERFAGDYDHLSRFGEWDGNQLATLEDLS